MHFCLPLIAVCWPCRLHGTLSNRRPQPQHFRRGAARAPHCLIRKPSSAVSCTPDARHDELLLLHCFQATLLHRRQLGQQEAVPRCPRRYVVAVQDPRLRHPFPQARDHTRARLGGGLAQGNTHPVLVLVLRPVPRHPSTRHSASVSLCSTLLYGLVLTCLPAAAITHPTSSSIRLCRSTTRSPRSISTRSS